MTRKYDELFTVRATGPSVSTGQATYASEQEKIKLKQLKDAAECQKEKRFCDSTWAKVGQIFLSFIMWSIIGFAIMIAVALLWTPAPVESDPLSGLYNVMVVFPFLFFGIIGAVLRWRKISSCCNIATIGIGE